MICFYQVVPQIIWLLWFPWVTTKSRHQLTCKGGGEDEYVTSWRNSPEGLKESYKKSFAKVYSFVLQVDFWRNTDSQATLDEEGFSIPPKAQTLSYMYLKYGQYYMLQALKGHFSLPAKLSHLSHLQLTVPMVHQHTNLKGFRLSMSVCRCFTRSWSTYVAKCKKLG